MRVERSFADSKIVTGILLREGSLRVRQFPMFINRCHGRSRVEADEVTATMRIRDV